MTGRTHDLAAFTALGFIVLTQPLPQMTLATGLVAVLANLVGNLLAGLVLQLAFGVVLEDRAAHFCTPCSGAVTKCVRIMMPSPDSLAE